MNIPHKNESVKKIYLNLFLTCHVVKIIQKGKHRND